MPGTDFVQFDHALFTRFADVQAHATTDGQGNSVIAYDANDLITLQHVAQQISTLQISCSSKPDSVFRQPARSTGQLGLTVG